MEKLFQVYSEEPVFRIHDILVWIRIQAMDPDPDSDRDLYSDPTLFIIDLQDANKKLF